MSVADLTPAQLRELSKYLDESPDESPRKDVYGDEVIQDQYWELLVKELGRLPRSKGRVEYSVQQVIDFGSEALRDCSPSRKLLRELVKRRKVPSQQTFISCLERISCVGAQNVFKKGTCPVFTWQPVAQKVRKGDQVVLTCEAQCDPPSPTYRWFRGDTAVPGSLSNHLIIREANRAHTGMYRCQATNPHINDPAMASQYSEWVPVEVTEAQHEYTDSPIRQEMGDRPVPQCPTITCHPEPCKKLQAGAGLVLECKGVGEGLVYKWYKDRKPLLLGQKLGRFEMRSVSVDDRGDYYCQVANDGGRVDSSHTIVTVVAPINITEQPQDGEGKVGDEVTLRCSAVGPPGMKLVYEWFKTGSESAQGTGQVFRRKLNLTSRREFKIFCKVSLADSPEMFTRSSIVKIVLRTIWFTRQPEAVERCIGDRAYLICTAESMPGQKVMYLWFRQDTRDGKKKLVKTCEDGVLGFRELSQKDWGYYLCQAQNEFEFISSKTVKVSMNVPGREMAVKAPVIRFIKQPWSWVVAEGGRFRLLCQAVCSSDEPVLYQWFFNSRELAGETNTQLVREPTEAGHYGAYFCEVRSQCGRARELSDRARVERASDAHRESAGRIGVHLEQWRAERRLMTVNGERYAVEKVALLIGNQRYENMTQLISPENDVLELTKLLQGLNFKVFSLVNLRFAEMMEALEIFYEMLAVPGVYALFYYSGHGFIHNKINYLMPVGATLPPRCDYNIVSDEISGRMQKKMSRALKILDCCRVRYRSEDIVPPQKPYPASNSGFANIYEIDSCPEDHMAYDTIAEPNSSFNVAFREALRRKRSMPKIFQHIIESMRTAAVGDVDEAHQRPWTSGSLADDMISLHDEIMRDDSTNESKLEEICDKWETAHVVPDPITLTATDLGELSEVVSAQLTFSAQFTNVLLITIQLTLDPRCTTAHVDFDQTFMEDQGVMVDILERDVTENDAGASSSSRTTRVRVTHVQRLKKQLTLVFTISVTLRGIGAGERQVRVAMTLPEWPLIARLLIMRTPPTQ